MSDLQFSQTFLSAAQVAPEVFDLRQDYRALLMVVEGITPGPSDQMSETLLKHAEKATCTQLGQCSVNDMPHIAAWQNAYKAFGAKPKKHRNSLEALTRRVETGLPRVNRLTDIYNAISIKHQIPLGGEDLDKYEGAPRLVRATGKEDFETMTGGEVVVEHPSPGEVVWCDDAGVTCRRWNWRQGPRTSLTDKTTRALFILDVLDPVSNESLGAAAEELVSMLKQLSPNIRVERRIISVATN
jgi:DNA/RNA-binding domain of Phe-tRNA-synthetase-like protein